MVITRLAGRPRIVRCKRCDGHVASVGALSARGLCEGCWQSAVIQSMIDQKQRRGRHYDAWLAGTARMLTNRLAADVSPPPEAPIDRQRIVDIESAV